MADISRVQPVEQNEKRMISQKNINARLGFTTKVRKALGNQPANSSKAKARPDLKSHQLRKATPGPKEKSRRTQKRKPSTDELADAIAKVSRLEVSLCPIEKPAGVTDIDIDDSGDPQLCSDNVMDIVLYWKDLEMQQTIRPDFMLSCSHITPKMRVVLVDWLMQVHTQFSLYLETLHMTIGLVDRYLSSTQGPHVKKQQLQLIGVTAMFIACKYEEMLVPEIGNYFDWTLLNIFMHTVLYSGDFVYITNNAFTNSQIRDMEIKILAVLHFKLGRPLSINFLRRFSKCNDVTATIHTVAKFILEQIFLQPSICHIKPSLQAASAILVSQVINAGDDDIDLGTAWSPNLQYYSGYDMADVKPVAKSLCSMMMKAYDSKQTATIDKYSRTSHLKVAQMLQQEMNLLAKLKDAC
jgi:hypothetical protein